jgi:hypothetical protein
VLRVYGYRHCVRYIAGSHSNALIYAALTAYTQHHGLVLSPDVIWNTIASGAAVHIKQNAEAMRDKFVKHQVTTPCRLSILLLSLSGCVRSSVPVRVEKDAPRPKCVDAQPGDASAQHTHHTICTIFLPAV